MEKQALIDAANALIADQDGAPPQSIQQDTTNLCIALIAYLNSLP